MPCLWSTSLRRAFCGSASVLLVAALASGCSGTNGATATKEPSAWSLVALGDSIVTGGESGTAASYAELYAGSLERRTGRMVHLENLADASETSASLLDRLTSDAQVRSAVGGADIVTVTVGGNDGDPFAEHDADACAPDGDLDRCVAGYAPDFATNLDRILSEIEMLRRGSPTAVRVTSPDYDPFIGRTAIDGVPSFPPGLRPAVLPTDR